MFTALTLLLSLIIVATAEDDVPNQVDRALEQYSGMKEKFITHGAKEGWIDFLSEMDKYPKTFERIRNTRY